MESSTAEVWVKIYAVLAWIGALFSVLAGIFMFFGGGFMGTIMATMMPGYDSIAGGAFGALFMIMGAVLIALAVFDVFVGKDLWAHKSWARIAAIVLSVLSIFSFPLGTIIGAWGIYLFGFDETVKGLFGASAKKKQ